MFSSLVQFVKKKRDKSKFSLLAILFKNFFIKIQFNISEKEKKPQRIYDLLYTETKPKENIRNNWSFLMASLKLRP